MNREETKQAAEVMLAFARGQQIESRHRGLGPVDWEPTHFPQWNWLSWEYRIAPTKQKYVVVRNKDVPYAEFAHGAAALVYQEEQIKHLIPEWKEEGYQFEIVHEFTLEE